MSPLALSALPGLSGTGIGGLGLGGLSGMSSSSASNSGHFNIHTSGDGKSKSSILLLLVAAGVAWYVLRGK